MSEPGPILVNLKTTPEPASHGVDQTWESNARMPRQMRNVNGGAGVRAGRNRAVSYRRAKLAAFNGAMPLA